MSTRINNSLGPIYTTLLSREWKGQAIWEQIKEKKLTSVPSLTGKLYQDGPGKKVMVVGRAVNGWEVEFDDCSSLESTVQSVLNQKNRLDDFACDSIVDEHGKIYYYAKSPFLRMMRQLVASFSGSEKNWQQRLVWSNLFKIAPRNGGNPSWKMIRQDIPLYRDLLKAEILENKPDVVVFATDMNFFDPYPGSEKYASFKELVCDEKTEAITSEFVCLAGSFVDDPNIKIIVCKRPEYRPVPAIVEGVVATYNKL